MKITPVEGIGKNRPLCTTKIRVAADLKTRAAQHGAWQRKRLGLPIDQCGAVSDFIVDGEPTCRTHASAMALNHIITNGKATDQ